MTTQRMTHGITFNQCPKCFVPMGQRGMAAHLKAQHGVQAATSRPARRPKALSTPATAALRRAITNGRIDTDETGFGSLLKAGFVTADGVVTADGIARLS
jgi:hypothetical protein